MPEGEPFFDSEEISDLQTRFFVAELVREKIFELFGDLRCEHVMIFYYSLINIYAKVRRYENQMGIGLNKAP